MSTTTAVRARDLMQTDVATLSPEDTLESALALFEESGISGAPVIANGRLCGMLTQADVSRPEHHLRDRTACESELQLPAALGEERVDELDPAEACYVKEDYSVGVLGRELVSDWMSSGVIAVPPSASMQRLCQVMVEHQIHRVCVTEEGRLLGLVTSFDVVRHIAGQRKLPRARAQRR